MHVRWDEGGSTPSAADRTPPSSSFHLYLPAEANRDWRVAEGETSEDVVRRDSMLPSGLGRTAGMTSVGILAYGSLISDPGVEITPLIVRRLPATTPFPVEYARLSRSRGGAPTVVPHSSGCPVKAEVLVLSDSVSLADAKSLLWRRETRNEGSDRTYRGSTSPNAVLVRDEPGLCGLSHVLYTDFNPGGKLSDPHPQALAEAAIGSVTKAPSGKDGISYLVDLINAGVETQLTPGYIKHILGLTGAASLGEALDSLKTRG